MITFSQYLNETWDYIGKWNLPGEYEDAIKRMIKSSGHIGPNSVVSGPYKSKAETLRHIDDKSIYILANDGIARAIHTRDIKSKTGLEGPFYTISVDEQRSNKTIWKKSVTKANQDFSDPQGQRHILKHKGAANMLLNQRGIARKFDDWSFDEYTIRNLRKKLEDDKAKR